MNKTIKILISVLIVFLACKIILAEEARESRGSKIVSRMEFSELKMVKPKFERFVLSNGLTVYLMDDRRSPMIKLEAMVKTGSLYDKNDKAGLAGLAGYVMKSGGSFSDPDAFNRQLDESGISFYAETDMESAILSLSCLKEDADIGLEIFRQILTNPCYNEKTLLFCKTQIREALRRIKDSPNSILRDNFRKLVYGNFPYNGNNLTIGSRYNKEGSVMGISPETLVNISIDDLMEFHKEYFCPQNVIIGIVGDFKGDMADKVKVIFSSWEKSASRVFKLPPLGVDVSANPGIFFFPKEELTQSTVIMGHICADKLSDDYFALEILGEVLGGSFGARLPTEVRVKRGLAYSVNGYIGWNYAYPGMLTAFAQTKNESTAEVIKVMTDEIAKIKSFGITDEELKTAKEAKKNNYITDFINKNIVLKKLMRDEYFGASKSHSENYCFNIDKVTKDDVLSVARKYLHPDKMTILIVGNPKVKIDLEKEFGKVNIIEY